MRGRSVDVIRLREARRRGTGMAHLGTGGLVRHPHREFFRFSSDGVEVETRLRTCIETKVVALNGWGISESLGTPTLI